jgi:Flp pilus assembly protein TadD
LAYREGRLERAFELLLEAAARNKKDPRPYRWMAIIAKNKGDREGVERYERQFREVLQRRNHPRAKKS